MLDRTPVVFISYSWTSKEYQQKVIELASRIRHDSVDVKLDVWDLKSGQDKYVYMEQCVTNPDIDKVLILSDKLYAEKADQRKGGVGDETTIISAEVYGSAEQQKFIPVVMERDENGKKYLPTYLKSRMYRDLSGDNYEEEYLQILRLIYDVPEYRKPALGKRPKWLTEDTPDDLFGLKEEIKGIKSDGSNVREFIDAYIESLKKFYVKDIQKDVYLKSFKDLKAYRDVFLDHLKAFSSSISFGILLAEEFEQLNNSLLDINTFEPESRSYKERDFDLFRVHVWELFVCAVTFMLHYSMFKNIHDLLAHTYFLKISPLSGNNEPISYAAFRHHSEMLEDIIKPQMEGELSRKYTLLGHFMNTEREYLPIYSHTSISNADLFLYQIYNALEIEEISPWYHWFPILYIYADESNSMWKKLISKSFCKKILPLFGVQSIEEMKALVSKCEYDKECRYSGAWHGAASVILSWIKVEDIAKLP